MQVPYLVLTPMPVAIDHTQGNAVTANVQARFIEYVATLIRSSRAKRPGFTFHSRLPNRAEPPADRPQLGFRSRPFAPWRLCEPAGRGQVEYFAVLIRTSLPL